MPTALGREFDPSRAAREAIQDDEQRNRDLARVEAEVLASEEAEQIVRIGLLRLARRQAVQAGGGRVRPGKHPHASELLEYYSRSLSALDEGAPAVLPSVRTAIR